MTTPDTAQPARSRARRNVVGRSPNRDEYVRLMEAGWSSLTLERYAAFRYGEDIPSSTFRLYRKRLKIEVKVSPWKNIDPEQVIDVLRVRSELIQLQQERIKIDVQHEQQMNKLFGSTKGEIAALSSLLDAHKSDLQDVGVMPKAGEKIEFTGPKATPADAPKKQTLSDLLGTDPEKEIEVARVLHLAKKQEKAG